MKWKNNIVIFAGCLMGVVYASSLEENSNKVVDGLVDCKSVCSRVDSEGSTNLKRNLCTCHDESIDGSVSKNNTFVETNEEGSRVKRQTIKELIEQRNKIVKKHPTTFKLLEKPGSKFNINKLNQKLKISSKPTSILSEIRQKPRNKEFGSRLKDLKSRFSIKPRFQTRSGFPENDKSKDLIKQLQDRREKVMNNLKTTQAKPMLGKDSQAERVGAAQSIQNRIETVGSNLKNKLKQKIDERKHVKESEIKTKETTSKEIKNESSHSSTTTTEATRASTFSSFKDTSTSETTQIVETQQNATTKKSEAILNLEKIKEKQKDAVIKIKDKLSVAKNRSKKFEITDDKN